MTTDSEDCFSQICQWHIPVISNAKYQSCNYLKDRLTFLLKLTRCKKFFVEPEPVLLKDATKSDKDRFETKKDRTVGLFKRYG